MLDSAVQGPVQPPEGGAQVPVDLGQLGPELVALDTRQGAQGALDLGQPAHQLRQPRGHGTQFGASGHTGTIFYLMASRAKPAPTLKQLDLRSTTGDLRRLLPAPEVVADESAAEAVRLILEEVKSGGDEAVRAITERFDRVRIDELRVSPDAVKAALEEIPLELRTALEAAHDNITDYHRTQLHPDTTHFRDGIKIRELKRPVSRAGLYVPGGRAPLASTVLMTAVPARVAGVDQLAMCSPPCADGSPAKPVLAAAAIAGVDEVYRIGGAQAVAAMAYGTETMKPVDVIVGPGNRYVAIAERMVAGEGAVGVPSAFTGPSEVAVIADDSTNATFAAIDLIVQAEHGPDGLSYLITWSEDVASRVNEEVTRLTAESPRRNEIEETFKKGGFSVLVDDADHAMQVANVVAPEHLEIMTADPERLVAKVKAAGAVFLGQWAPASLGDYAAGPNHVLPTARSARFGGALGVDDFLRPIHVVEVDKNGLEQLAPVVEAMARSEGLAAHEESVRLRLRDK